MGNRWPRAVGFALLRIGIEPRFRRLLNLSFAYVFPIPTGTTGSVFPNGLAGGFGHTCFATSRFPVIEWTFIAYLINGRALPPRTDKTLDRGRRADFVFDGWNWIVYGDRFCWRHLLTPKPPAIDQLESAGKVRMNLHLGYLPSCIGRVTELHAVYYARTAGFGAAFEAKVAAQLAEFCLRYVDGRDGLWLASPNIS